jgi:peptidyl-prolyl cis-trans isomerase B (cyclophilin B)
MFFDMGKNSNANQATQLRQFRAEEKARKQAEKRRSTIIACLLVFGALAIVAAVILLVVFTGNAEGTGDGGTSEENRPNSSQGYYDNGAPFMDDLDMSDINLDAFSETDEVTNYVKLNVSYTDNDGAQKTGDIVIRLYDNVAPKTVENFQNLVKSGFYTNSSFHRALKDKLIQGGSGAGETLLTPIRGEYTNNGFYNNLEHHRGVVAMARTINPDSATSQFYIMCDSDINLDFNYATFGYVAYGMETVDAIASLNVVANYQMNGEVSLPEHTVTINSAVFITHEKN